MRALIVIIFLALFMIPANSSPLLQKVTVFDPISNIREKPDGKILCKIKKIQEIYVEKFNNSWFSTNFCIEKGYIHKSQIKFAIKDGNIYTEKYKLFLKNIKNKKTEEALYVANEILLDDKENNILTKEMYVELLRTKAIILERMYLKYKKSSDIYIELLKKYDDEFSKLRLAILLEENKISSDYYLGIGLLMDIIESGKNPEYRAIAKKFHENNKVISLQEKEYAATKDLVSLGNIYYEGDVNVKKDFKMAFKYYKKAAERGSATAQYYIGVMYFTGNGVYKDSNKTLEWFEKSASQGNKDALEGIRVLTSNSKSERKVVSNQSNILSRIAGGIADFIKDGNRTSSSSSYTPPSRSLPKPCYDDNICYEVIREKSRTKDRVTYEIRCTRGSNTGMVTDICGSSRGKWAYGCGFLETGWHNDSAQEAGYTACR